MSEPDSILDTTLTRPLSDLVSVNGIDMRKGDRIRRIEHESDSGLKELRDLCLMHSAEDTLELVEREQAKRAGKKVPEWKTITVWVSIATLVLSVIAWVLSKG